jgi:hypothetical protein
MYYRHREPKHYELCSDDTLHVIAVISNPVMYATRYRLAEQFIQHMAEFPEVRLTVVEHAFGDRHFEVIDRSSETHVRVRGSHEIWLKENLVNIGLRHLPPNWRYVSWVDADVRFLNPDWARETLHALQHYAVVQPFEGAVDMGPHNNVFDSYSSFAKEFVNGSPPTILARSGYYSMYGKKPYAHPGYAWAARREFINNVGGLLDFAIVGAGDHHMALSMVGQAAASIPEKDIHSRYVARVLEWERCALKANMNIGYVRGTIAHHWHGPKARRQYWKRWDILTENGFNPDTDLAYDAQGLLLLTNTNPRLRDALRAYFRQRNEDSRDED